MHDLPQLFLDLMIIMIYAGATTLIFKWLKQPLVLGYPAVVTASGVV